MQGQGAPTKSDRVVRNLHFHLTARAVRNTWCIGLLGIVLALATPTAFFGQRCAQVQGRTMICTSRCANQDQPPACRRNARQSRLGRTLDQCRSIHLHKRTTRSEGTCALRPQHVVVQASFSAQALDRRQVLDSLVNVGSPFAFCLYIHVPHQ